MMSHGLSLLVYLPLGSLVWGGEVLNTNTDESLLLGQKPAPNAFSPGLTF